MFSIQITYGKNLRRLFILVVGVLFFHINWISRNMVGLKYIYSSQKKEYRQKFDLINTQVPFMIILSSIISCEKFFLIFF